MRRRMRQGGRWGPRRQRECGLGRGFEGAGLDCAPLVRARACAVCAAESDRTQEACAKSRAAGIVLGELKACGGCGGCGRGGVRPSVRQWLLFSVVCTTQNSSSHSVLAHSHRAKTSPRCSGKSIVTLAGTPASPGSSDVRNGLCVTAARRGLNEQQPRCDGALSPDPLQAHLNVVVALRLARVMLERPLPFPVCASTKDLSESHQCRPSCSHTVAYIAGSRDAPPHMIATLRPALCA